MKWYCTVCGYVYEGPEAPEACPVCKAPKEKFKQMDEEASFATVHEVGVAQGSPEDIMADLRANFEGECSEVGMYLAMDEGEITNVAVAPVERCHGVGGMLLTELLKIAENKGVARIVLEVRASNDSAIRLYERNGFVQCGMRKGFYEFPKEDAYVMVHGH